MTMCESNDDVNIISEPAQESFDVIPRSLLRRSSNSRPPPLLAGVIETIHRIGLHAQTLIRSCMHE